MSDSLIIRKRLHRFILSRCNHWGLKRQRIPRAPKAPGKRCLKSHPTLAL